MRVYVTRNPFTGEWMAIKEGYRRGPISTSKSGISRMARRIVREAGGGQVLWLNDVNKVEREDRLDGTLRQVEP